MRVGWASGRYPWRGTGALRFSAMLTSSSFEEPLLETDPTTMCALLRLASFRVRDRLGERAHHHRVRPAHTLGGSTTTRTREPLGRSAAMRAWPRVAQVSARTR